MKYGASTLIIGPGGPGRVQIAVENSGTSINWPPQTGFGTPSTCSMSNTTSL